MKTIRLTQGKVAIVDDADYERVNSFKWYANKARNHGYEYTYYAMRNILISKFKWGTVRMHRFILNAPDGVEVDHRDGNGLNDQRSNLRLCTHAENQRHQGLNRRNTSGFKGVTFTKFSIQKPYHAKIKVNNKSIHLGLYKTAQAAARAYDVAALKHHGDFALTNKVLGLYQKREAQL